MSRSSNEIIRSRRGGRRHGHHASLQYRARFAYDTLLLLPIFVQASERVPNVKALACDSEGSVGLLSIKAVVGIVSWYYKLSPSLPPKKPKVCKVASGRKRVKHTRG